MKRIIKSSAVILATYAGTASATQVFTFEGFGAISRSMGGIAAAYDIGPAGMVANPATLGLSNDDGSFFMVGADLITPDIESKNLTSGEVAKSSSRSRNRGPYLAPQFAVGHGVDGISFGMGVFANGGVGTEFGGKSFLSNSENNSATNYENSSRLLVLRMPFSASYDVSDKFTVGASVDAVWTSLNLELLLPSSQVGALAADGNLSGSLVPTLATVALPDGAAHISFTKNKYTGGGVDSIGLGGRLGFVYQLNDKTSIGAAYNFETDVGDLKGRAVLTAMDGNGTVVPLPGNIKIRNFEMPASLRLGFAHDMNEKLSLAFDYQRVYWSDVMKNIDVGFVADGGVGDIDILLPHNYDDINVYSLGISYKYSVPLTLRGGFSYADNPIPAGNMLAVVPVYLTTHLSLGFSYELNENGVIDMAYSHAFENSVSDNGYLNSGDRQESTHSQDNVTISYTYNF